MSVKIESELRHLKVCLVLVSVFILVTYLRACASGGSEGAAADRTSCRSSHTAGRHGRDCGHRSRSRAYPASVAARRTVRRTHTHTHTHARTRTRTHTRIHTHIHTHTHTHIYRHAHETNNMSPDPVTHADARERKEKRKDQLENERRSVWQGRAAAPGGPTLHAIIVTPF